MTAKQTCGQEIYRHAERRGARAAEHADPHRQAPARKLLKARILLKADASEAGEALTDSQIAVGLHTSLDTVARDRQQLVEEGVEAALTPKRSPNSARRRIFDGASEAKLIALACSTPPEGFARWTLQLLESKVVELNIVDARQRQHHRADAQKNALKPHLNNNGSSRRTPTPPSWPPWRMSSRFTIGRMIPSVPWSAWTRRRNN